jgi:hypothetical protein
MVMIRSSVVYPQARHSSPSLVAAPRRRQHTVTPLARPAAAAAVTDRTGSNVKTAPHKGSAEAMIVNLNKHHKQRERAEGERRVSMFWLSVSPVATNA